MFSLPYLDALLTISGNRLNDKLFGFKYTGIVLNWIVRVAITVIYVQEVIDTARFNSINATLSDLQELLLNSTGVLILLLFAYRRARIKHLLRHMTCQESSRSVRCFTLFSLLLAIGLLMLQITSDFVEAAVLHRRHLYEHVWGILKKTLMSSPTELNAYIFFYPFFYITVLKIFSYHELRQLQQLNQNLTIIIPFKVMKNIKALSQMRSELEHLFNVVPFFLFGVFFFIIPEAIISIARYDAKFDDSRSIFLTIHISYLIVVAILLLRQVCNSRDRVRDMVTQLIEIIHQTHATRLNTNDYLALTDALKSYADFSFTGWYLFRIDRSLVLTFVSSIITFSVLLIQLTPTYY